jgi:hypothetical protein
MKIFKDTKWLAFVEKCKKRVLADNKEFHIKSIFVPQPETCRKPYYLIVGMEPMLQNFGKMKKEIKEEDYIGFVHFGIDYCAYKFLCDNKYKWQLVDFCKGAMTSKNAKIKSNERYKKWLPLLEEEWKLLGKPPIIVVGKKLYNFIKSHLWNELKADVNLHYILHTSGACNGHRQKEYDHFKLNDNWFNEEAKSEMVLVIEKMFKPYQFNECRLKKMEKNLCKDIQRTTLLTLYKHNFQDLKKKGKIEHVPAKGGSRG